MDGEGAPVRKGERSAVNDRAKARCPACGAEMNLHAEKVDQSRGAEDADALDLELGGLLVEFHTCPGCGFVLERPAV